MEESVDLEISIERVLPVWWALMWRIVLFGALVGAFLGFCGGLIVGAAGHPELGAAVGALLGWLGSIPVSFVVLKVVLRKRFNGFRIRFVKIEMNE